MLNLKFALSMLVLASVASGFFPATAAAQNLEVFGGYQFTHLQPAFNLSGWNAALTKNFKHILGITGDFSGTYNGGFNAYTYTGGPVLTARLPAVQPFAHALFGGISVSGDGNNGFAMFLGGGLDVGMRNGLGIRIVQVDWLHTEINNISRDRNFRASTGIVLKF